VDRTKLKDELLRDEGRRLKVYRDTQNFYTIGVGHFLGSSPRMTEITQDESEALLERDMDNAETTAWSFVKNPDVWANDPRARALINMAFNLGYRLREFEKFLAAVNDSQWEQAAVEMLDSDWSKQVGERAKRLAQMVASGTEPAEVA